MNDAKHWTLWVWFKILGTNKWTFQDKLLKLGCAYSDEQMIANEQPGVAFAIVNSTWLVVSNIFFIFTPIWGRFPF